MNLFRLISRLAIIFVPPILVAIFAFAFVNSHFLTAANPEDDRREIVYVEPGADFSNLCTTLESKGIIKNCWSFKFLANLKSGLDPLTPGEYEFGPGMKPRDILERLASADVMPRKVNVPAGVTAWDVGDIIEQLGIASAEDFKRAITDPELLQRAGIPSRSFEGYLYPSDYEFKKPIDPKEIVWRMLERGEQHWKEEYTVQANNLSLSRHEVLTLASILQRLTTQAEEMKLISSVIHNRLNQGMRLELDVTLEYGIPGYAGTMTDDLRDFDSPYNTFKNYRLPPGPICNPGIVAIEAALYPGESEYLYFVRDGNSGYVFAATLGEHNRNLSRIK